MPRALLDGWYAGRPESAGDAPSTDHASAVDDLLLPCVGADWQAPRVHVRRAAAVAVLGLVCACTVPAARPPVDAHVNPATVPMLSRTQAWEALATLPRTERDPRVPAYDRDAFGEAWVDVDGNGCNQRDDVLLRDAVPGSTSVQRQGACDHDVLAGTWVDPYTGRELVLTNLKDPSQAQAVQIDHVVALAEAWRSGASGWDPARREAFANDLSVLVASDGPTNAAKSDDDPAAWRPRQGFQCAYARRWIAVKHAWDLAVDASEAAALEEMLARCAPGG